MQKFVFFSQEKRWMPTQRCGTHNLMSSIVGFLSRSKIKDNFFSFWIFYFIYFLFFSKYCIVHEINGYGNRKMLVFFWHFYTIYSNNIINLSTFFSFFFLLLYKFSYIKSLEQIWIIIILRICYVFVCLFGLI